MQQSYSIEVYHHFMCDTLSCLIIFIKDYLYHMTKINYKHLIILTMKEILKYERLYDKYGYPHHLEILNGLWGQLDKMGEKI